MLIDELAFNNLNNFQKYFLLSPINHVVEF